MAKPEITFAPIKAGVTADAARQLDVIVALAVAKPPLEEGRAPVDLALVLDRSGSMAGQKIAFARSGASAAVGLLGPQDRVSLTVFNHRVDALSPLSGTAQSSEVHARIALIEADGNTDLHGGWAAGAGSLGQPTSARGARVVLLTDGQTNHGVTDPGAIAAAVAEAGRRGIATSALGIGEDYNEELLESISRAGDGSYYYVENAEQLPGLFEAELRGFKAVAGREVRLRVTPGTGVEIVSVLNDFPASDSGGLELPNMLAGGRQEIGLTVRALAGFPGKPGDDAEVCTVHLTWTEPESGERAETRLALRLPVLEAAAWDALPRDAGVAESAALLRSARAKREAMRSIDNGDEAGLKRALAGIGMALEGLADSPRLASERISMASLQRDLDEGKRAKFRKNVHYEAYARGQAMDEARLTGHYRYKLLYLAGSLIGFESGNLATFDKGAIVNSRSDDTASGLDEALRRAGGPAFRAACEAIGPLGVGIAAVTGAGGLLASAVLHVRVPDWRGGSSGEAEALASCYEACLETAIRNGYRHVAFPLLGSGGRGFPLMLAARIGLESIARQLISGPARIGVTFVIPDQSVLEAVRSLLP